MNNEEYTNRPSGRRRRRTRTLTYDTPPGMIRRRPERNESVKETVSARPASTRRPTSRPPSRRQARPDMNKRPQRSEQNLASKKPVSKKIPPVIDDNIRIIPLGGVEEIGKNMTAIETKDDIIVIDCGFQFRDETTPGIDYILPNTKYLEEKKEKIRAVIITHGHLDHIGAIPYLMPKLGNPPLYSRRLTTVMIKKRQEEFPQVPLLDIKEVESNEKITLGKLKIKFFAVTHTIPDSMGVIIETPYGNIVFTGDLKLDHVNGIPTEEEENNYKIFDNEKTLLLVADSTNVERPGFSIPESVVHENIAKIIKETKGRLIIGTFASQLDRIIGIIEVAEKYNKKVVIEGRSMKNNIDIIRHLKILKTKKGTIIPAEEMDNYPPDRIVALATGAQGDEYAALVRMSVKNHKYFKINPRDTVLLSSSVIPGNESAVQKLKDNVARQGAKIIHYRVSDVHSSGHANRDEAMWVHLKVKPKFFIPVHGFHYMLRVHVDLAKSLGMPEENTVIPDNGSIIEIQNKGQKIVKLKETVPSSPVMVDGFAMGDMQEVVIRDRQLLSEDGMFVIIASINPKTGKLRKSPDIISRGFVYLRESQDLLHKARNIIKRTVEETTAGMNPINFDYVKSTVTDEVGKFLFQQTAKRPIVIPVIIGV
jgi:ribonuclease J